jgi:hypothetical protein
MNTRLATAAPQIGVPALIGRIGSKGVLRFLEFFTVNIRNKNTRAAYTRAAGDFLSWCEGQGISELGRVQPVHVAAYIELLQGKRSAPTVKQHLRLIRPSLRRGTTPRSKQQKSVDRDRAQSHPILRRSVAEPAKLQKARFVCDKAGTTPSSVPHPNPRPPARRRASTLALPRHRRRHEDIDFRPPSGRLSPLAAEEHDSQKDAGGSTSATGYTGEGKSALCALNGMRERRLQISESTRFDARKQ